MMPAGHPFSTLGKGGTPKQSLMRRVDETITGGHLRPIY